MTYKSAWPLFVAFAAMIATPAPTLASTTESAGDALFVLLPLTGIVTAVVKKDREGQLQFVKSFATNAAVTVGLKSVIDKRRPDGDCCDSFPSAHSSFAFMGASFIEKRYGSRYAIPAYTAATFVAYSRVHADKHFVEDVIAGAAIGYLSSELFTTRFEGLTVLPVAGRDFTGIAFSQSW